MVRGVVYVVIGSNHLTEYCLKSVRSLRSQGYDGPVVVLTDHAEWAMADPSLHLDTIVLPSEGSTPFVLSRRAKTSLYSFSPFVETLFLDVDTEIQAPIDGLWTYLDHADLAMAIDIYPTWGAVQRTFWHHGVLSVDEVLATRTLCGTESTYYNAGVIAFRKTPATAAFFDQWHQEWQIYRDKDQPPLRRALTRTGLPVATLPPKYNWHATHLDDGTPAVVYHYWKRRSENKAPHGAVPAARSWKSLAWLAVPRALRQWVQDRRKAARLRARLPEALKRSPYRKEFL